MPDGSGGFRQDLTCPALLRIPLGMTCISCTGLSPAMVRLSRSVPLHMSIPHRGPTTPVAPKRPRFGLFPFRSPLLGESLLVFFSSRYLDVSVPWVGTLSGIPTSSGWVAPFGNPRITGYYAPPRGLSQPIASFVASESQGIHRTPLVTSRSFQDHNCSVDRSLGLFWSVQQHVKERWPGKACPETFGAQWRISESNR